MGAVALHVAQQLIDVLRFRDEHGRAHEFGDLRPAIIGRQREQPGDQIFHVDHAEHVVGVLADDRDPGEARAVGQVNRLAERLGRLDPHHLGARHHDLAHDGVAEIEDGLQHLAFRLVHDAAITGEVDHLAQFHIRRERAPRESAPGSQRVPDDDQQLRDGRQDTAQRPRRPGQRQPHRVRMLPAQRARKHPDRDVAHDEHDDRHDREVEAPRPEGHSGHRHRRRHLGGKPQHEQQVDVAGTIRRDCGERRCAAPVLALQLLDAGGRDGADGGVRGGQCAGDRNEYRREDKQRDVDRGHGEPQGAVLGRGPSSVDGGAGAAPSPATSPTVPSTALSAACPRSS